MKIYSYANKNWTKLLKAFNIKNLTSPEEALSFKKAIIFVSDDLSQQFSEFSRKLEANEVIITRLPSDNLSEFNKDELASIISKALGITS